MQNAPGVFQNKQKHGASDVSSTGMMDLWKLRK